RDGAVPSARDFDTLGLGRNRAWIAADQGARRSKPRRVRDQEREGCRHAGGDHLLRRARAGGIRPPARRGTYDRAPSGTPQQISRQRTHSFRCAYRHIHGALRPDFATTLRVGEGRGPWGNICHRVTELFMRGPAKSALPLTIIALAGSLLSFSSVV